MLIAQWRGYFFLILLVKRAKLLTHDCSSGCLATAYAIEKLLLKTFCNNGFWFWDNWRGIYRRIKRQEWKQKHEEKHRVLEESFQKVGKWKKLPSKFRRVREQCPRPNTVLVLCHDTKRKRDDYEPNCLKVMQAPLERYLKSKAYPQSIIWDREFLNSRKVLEGKARKLQEQGRGKQPNWSRSLTKEEEEVLWHNSQLGGGTPRALLNTMWWLLTQHFGLEGQQEHHQMKVEDFT